MNSSAYLKLLLKNLKLLKITLIRWRRQRYEYLRNRIYVFQIRLKELNQWKKCFWLQFTNKDLKIRQFLFQNFLIQVQTQAKTFDFITSGSVPDLGQPNARYVFISISMGAHDMSGLEIS